MPKRRRGDGVPWRRSNHTGARASNEPPAPSSTHGSGDAQDDRDFKGWLLWQFADGQVSAKRTCEGAWHLGSYARDLGVDHIARSPQSQTGSFNKYLESKLGMAEFIEKFVLFVKIPQHSKKYGRKLLGHPFLCPHQQADEFPDDCLVKDFDIFQLPGIQELRTVREQGPLSLALGRVYVDGVDVGGRSRKKPKKVWVYLWTPLGASGSLSSRRLITVLLQDRCCKSCGCGGRCTRQAVWRVIAWSFSAYRRGRHPSKGPFKEALVGEWKRKAKTRIKHRGCLAHAGADWEAISDTMGTRRWNHCNCPCPWCSTDLESMGDHSKEAPLLVHDDWIAAKAATQITVKLCPGLGGLVRASLQPDVRQKGSKGLALTANVGALKAGDRLEQIDDGCHDIVECDLTKLPADTSLHFFRPNPHSRLTFWCPLIFDNCDIIDDEDKIDEEDNIDEEPVLDGSHIVGDVLHTVDGGVAQYAGGSNYNLVLENAVMALKIAPGTKATVEKHAIDKINSMLNAWYLTPEARGFEPMTDVVKRTLIGSGAPPCIDAKAMHSRMLFLFSIVLLSKIESRLQGQVRESAKGLLRASECLQKWYGIIQKPTTIIPETDCKNAIRLARKHCTLWSAHSGHSCKPKHHALVDMSRQMRKFGNPSKFSTYNDESFNGLAARLARSVHPANFALAVLKKYFLRRSLKGQPF